MDLVLYPIAKDGDCLFNACRIGLRLLFPDTHPIYKFDSFAFRIAVIKHITLEIENESQWGSDYNIEVIMTVRDAIINKHIRRWHGITADMADNLEDLEKLSEDDLLQALKTQAISYYSAHMCTRGVWGGHVELSAIQNMYGIRIVLHDIDGNQRLVDTAFDNKELDNDLHLKFIGSHYDLLAPAAKIALKPNINENNPLSTAREDITQLPAPTEQTNDKQSEVQDSTKDAELAGRYKLEAHFLIKKHGKTLDKKELNNLERIVREKLNLQAVNKYLVNMNIRICKAELLKFQYSTISYVVIQGLTRFTTDMGKIIQSQFPNLQTLNLANGNITTLYADNFTNLPKLKSVLLHNNNLVHIDENTFRHLQLEELYLHNNLIKVLPKNLLAGQERLRLLSLNHNPITLVDPDFFKGLVRLRTLRLPDKLLQNLQIYRQLLPLFYHTNLIDKDSFEADEETYKTPGQNLDDKTAPKALTMAPAFPELKF